MNGIQKSIEYPCSFRNSCTHVFTAVLGTPQSSIDLNLGLCLEGSQTLNIVLIDVKKIK